MCILIHAYDTYYQRSPLFDVFETRLNIKKNEKQREPTRREEKKEKECIIQGMREKERMSDAAPDTT